MHMSLFAGVFLGTTLALAAISAGSLGWNIYKKEHKTYLYEQCACIGVLLFIALLIALHG